MAVFAAGAAGGILARAITDISTNHAPSFADYAGAALGGAITAEGTHYAAALTGGVGAGAGFVAAGAAGGAAGEMLSETLKGQSLDGVKVGVAAVVGAATNVPGGFAIKGLNAGRNSMASGANQVATKLAKGQIKNISGKTAWKIFVGTVANGTNSMGVTAGANVVKNILCSSSSGSNIQTHVCSK